MENLPCNILTKIFDLLDFNSILKAALVCKKFSNVIIENPKLLKNVKISIDLRNIVWNEGIQRQGASGKSLSVDAILKSQRKYRNLHVSSYNSDKIFHFIDKFGCDLNELSLHGFITKRDFLCVLEKLPNLERAAFDIEFDDEEFLIPEISTLCEKLKFLKCENDLNVFLEIFKGSNFQLSEIDFNGFKVLNQLNLELFRNFLTKQSQLKTLKIQCINATDLFTQEFQSKVSFQLEKFEVSDLATESPESHASYLDFLKSQKVLRKVKIISTEWNISEPYYQDDLLESLLGLEELESIELNFSRIDFESSIFTNVNENVKTLVYQNQDADVESLSESQILDKFINCMPNLECLEISSSAFVDAESLEILNELKNLRSLTVKDYCSIDCVEHLVLPNLQKLIVCGYDEDQDDEEEMENRINSQIWETFFEIHPKLSHFNFNLEFKESTLENLFKTLKELQHIELTISTFDAAKTILENHYESPELKFIKITVQMSRGSGKSESFYELFGAHGFVENCGLSKSYLEFSKAVESTTKL